MVILWCSLVSGRGCWNNLPQPALFLHRSRRAVATISTRFPLRGMSRRVTLRCPQAPTSRERQKGQSWVLVSTSAWSRITVSDSSQKDTLYIGEMPGTSEQVRKLTSRSCHSSNVRPRTKRGLAAGWPAHPAPARRGRSCRRTWVCLRAFQSALQCFMAVRSMTGPVNCAPSARETIAAFASARLFSTSCRNAMALG